MHERLRLGGEAVQRALQQLPGAEDLGRNLRRRLRGRALAGALHRLVLQSRRRHAPSTVIQTLRANVPGTEIAPDVLKRDVNPRLVIDQAHRRYGIDLASCEIASGKDGLPRIVCEGKVFNLGDFLTKRLGRPWAEARALLQDCYHASVAAQGPEPDRVLWRQFSEWQQRRQAEAGQMRARLRPEFRAEILAVRAHYMAAKERARPMKPRTRAVYVAKARAERVLAEQAIAMRRQTAYIALRQPPRQVLYREYLVTLADGGDRAALAELRRMAPMGHESDDLITGRRSRAAFALPRYQVDARGCVTYKSAEGALVRDGVHGITVLRASDSAYEAAIRVALARYGREVSVQGDALFKRGMLKAAQRMGLEMHFHDADRPDAAPFFVPARGRDRERDR